MGYDPDDEVLVAVVITQVTPGGYLGYLVEPDANGQPVRIYVPPGAVVGLNHQRSIRAGDMVRSYTGHVYEVMVVKGDQAWCTRKGSHTVLPISSLNLITGGLHDKESC